MSFREKILLALARLACRRYVLVLVGGAVLTALAILVMARQGYSSSFNIARMLPQNIPAARAFTKSLTDFGTVDEAVVVWHLNPDDPRSAQNAGKIADAVAAKAQQHRDINHAFTRLLTDDEKSYLLNVELPKHGMLLLRPDDLALIAEKLTPAAIDNSIANTIRKLTTIDADSSAGEALLLNALGLADIFRGRFEQLLGGDDKKTDADNGAVVVDSTGGSPSLPASGAVVVDSTGGSPSLPASGAEKKRDDHGYLVSPDGKMLLLIIEPKYAAQNVAFARRIMEFIENTVYEILVGAAPLTPSDGADWRENFRALASDPPFAALYASIDKTAKAKWQAVIDSPPPSTASTPSTESTLSTPSTSTAADDETLRLALASLNDTLRAGKFLAPNAVASVKEKTARLASLGYDPELARAALNLAAGRDFLSANHLAVAPNSATAQPEAMLKNFRVEFAGGYQISRRYADKVNGIMLGTLALSAVLVLLFFGWCFRRLGVLLYIGAPLLMIICWTGGIGWLLFGQLNLISCAFAAVLVGLGVDYAVHIYNRYIEERGRGAEVEAAFTTAIEHTGWGVLVGMLTTCFAFLALIATRFHHLSEFGALGAIGIFISGPTMMLVMPALIVLRNKWRPESLRIFTPSEFCLPRVTRFVEKHLRAVFVVSTVAIFGALAAIFFGGALSFDSSMAALRPRDRAFEINGEITRAFSTRNPNKLNFIVSAESEEAALVKAAIYEERLRELQQRGLIAGYDSVTKFLPSPAAQRKLLAQMREIDFSRARADLESSLEKRKLDASYFAFNLRLLQEHAKLAETDHVVLPSDFRDSKLARLLNTLVAAKQSELDLKYGVPSDFKFPLTLAKAAATAETDRLLYPAGTVLSREQVEALIPADPAVTDKVYSLSYYDDGYAVKATIYPPLPENSRDAEPQLSQEWLQQVGKILQIDTTQFTPIENDIFYDAELTGVPIVSLVLAEIVKEDFLQISICIALICLATINLGYHPRPYLALAATVPLLFFTLYYRVAAPNLAPLTLDLIYAALSAVFIFGALAHRFIGRVFFCFLPVGAGLIYLFGFMAVMNLLGEFFGFGAMLNLNFVNVLTIPIILGVGVDNGIHLVERYYESGGDLRRVIVDTGRALTITALTSIAGFGSLMWAKFQGLDSIAQLGTLSVIAFLMVLLASVVVFPAVIATLSPRSREIKN